MILIKYFEVSKILFTFAAASRAEALGLTHQPSIRMPRWSRYDAELKLLFTQKNPKYGNKEFQSKHGSPHRRCFNPRVS